jgi:predicted permease
VQNDLPKLELRNTQLSPLESEDLFARTEVFETATAWVRRRPRLNGMGEPRQLSATRSLGAFFDVFGVKPVVGRAWRPEASRDGNHNVVMLSWGLWQELYGGDSAVVGKQMDLNGTMHEIVGVMPRAFQHPRGTDVYQPLEMNEDLRSPVGRTRLMMNFVGRLRPGVTELQLRQSLDAEAAKWRGEAAPPARAGYATPGPLAHRLVTTPFVDFLAGRLRPVLTVLMGAVVLVLLIACANVASLQLVRTAGRARDIGVRVALGARRGEIVRQLLVESLLLAAAGGALGLLLGHLVVGVLGHVAPAQFPQLEGLALDQRVLVFTMAIALGAGLAFGLLPALPASRVDVNATLKAGAGRGTSASGAHRRLLQGSVVVQVALTLMLLLGSTLVVRSLSGLLELDPGFRADHVVTLKVTPPASKYAATQVPLFYQQLVARIRTVPGVQTAGAAFGVPFSGDFDSSPFDIPEVAKAAGAPERHAEYRVITGDYFRALGIPVKRGRVFEPGDAPGAANAVVIDESLARQYFPGVDPVGRTIRQLGSANGSDWTVVGVVGAVMRAEIGETHKPTIYYHHPQIPWYSGLVLTVRATGTAPGDEEALASAVRRAVREFEPAALVNDVRTMQERVDLSLGARRLAVFVLSGFAVLALVLAVLGIYGVMSYGMSQRQQEIGIRMALGATAADVTRMVVRQGVRLAVTGLAVGLLAYAALGGLLDALLYGVAARDPLTMAGVAAVVTGAAILASWLPGRRASRAGTQAVLRA